jgi:hypothetical protein
MLDELGDDQALSLRAVAREVGIAAFKQEMAESTTAAVQRCMDAGAVPAGDAATVSLDLRAAVHDAVSMRVNEPDVAWPPLDGQVGRFLVMLVGGRALAATRGGGGR